MRFRFPLRRSTFSAASFSFLERSSPTTALAFSRAVFLLSWTWIALSILATATQPLEEIAPGVPVLFHSLGCTKNLTAAILIHRTGYQNSCVFKLSAPVAAQVNSIHIDIRMPPTLQRAITPILNVDIRFLIQLTNGGGRDFTAPQGLSDILYTPDRYACQIPFNERFFHAAFTATVPLNDGGFKKIPLSLGTFRVTSPEVVVRLRL